MRYIYNQKTGEVEPDRYVVKINSTAMPDGLCVDNDDKIWIAEWGGGRVCKWDPRSGKRIQQIKLPCKNATSSCIGGAKNKYLFITTATHATKKESFAGGLFRVKIR
jgi:sugar lactone lactonase YvrE